MDHVRVGVIGCGYWGPNLIRNFVELPGSRMVAVADLDAQRLEKIKRRYPQIDTTQHYPDLFQMSLDALVVATPPPTHFALARDGLEHGLHVLVEKPLTLNQEEAQKLIDLADNLGLVLMVGHTFEYNPAVKAVRDIIARGELGRVYYVNAVRVNLGLFQPHLDVLWDLAPHDLSILRYILGCDPVSVSARGASCIIKGTHDLAYLHLEFPGGIMANVHISWLDPCKIRRITVVGSAKMLVYDDLDPSEKIKIYDKGVQAPPSTDSFQAYQCSYRDGDVLSPRIEFSEPLQNECSHFLQCIERGMRPQSDGIAGLSIVRTLELASRSLYNGGERLFLFPSGGHGDRSIMAASA